MNATYRVTPRTDKKTGEEYYEGTVQLPGLKAAKLTKNDGCTWYATKSQAVQAAQRFSQRYGLLITEEEIPQVRKAAKKSLKKCSSTVTPPNSWTK